jgi:hypothetical protein
MLKKILFAATLLILFEPVFADDNRVIVKLPGYDARAYAE